MESAAKESDRAEGGEVTKNVSNVKFAYYV